SVPLDVGRDNRGACSPSVPRFECSAVGPSQLFECLAKGRMASARLGVIGEGIGHIDKPRDARLLRTRGERPRGNRAANQRDERASVHSITSSARRRKASGIFSPSTLAVVRLTTRSNLVGCSTGRSAGFAPRRILSTYSAARRKRSGKFGPYDIRPPA